MCRFVIFYLIILFAMPATIAGYKIKLHMKMFKYCCILYKFTIFVPKMRHWIIFLIMQRVIGIPIKIIYLQNKILYSFLQNSNR